MVTGWTLHRAPWMELEQCLWPPAGLCLPPPLVHALEGTLRRAEQGRLPVLEAGELKAGSGWHLPVLVLLTPGGARGVSKGTPWPAQPSVPPVVTFSFCLQVATLGAAASLPVAPALVAASPGVNLITRHL